VIVAKLYSLGVTVLTWFMGLIPDMSLPSMDEVYAAIADSRLWAYWGWGNHYLPLTLALGLLTLRLAVWAGLTALDVANWALTKLHVTGGSS
jgi:hypothetical protein